jgi:hypothetical protein
MNRDDRASDIHERVSEFLYSTRGDSGEDRMIQLVYRVLRLEDEVRALREQFDQRLALPQITFSHPCGYPPEHMFVPGEGWCRRCGISVEQVGKEAGQP